MSAIISKSPKQLTNSSLLHTSTQRLSQVRRHVSTTPSTHGKIQDAYILSAARTPTGKVCDSLSKLLPVLLIIANLQVQWLLCPCVSSTIRSNCN